MHPNPSARFIPELINLLEKGISTYISNSLSENKVVDNSHNDSEADIVSEFIDEACKVNPWFVQNDMIFALQMLVDDLHFLNHEITKTPLPDLSSHTMHFVLGREAPLEGIADMLMFAAAGIQCKIIFPEKLGGYLKQLIRLFEFVHLNDRLITAFRPGKVEGMVIMKDLNPTIEDYLKKFLSLHLFSRGRSYIATGYEDEKQWNTIAEMTCRYFGRGGQNIKVLFVPEGYDLTVFKRALEKYNWQINHHNYFNNFDYRKSSMIISKCNYEVAGSMLITESQNYAGFIGVLCVQYYSQNVNIKENELSLKYPVLLDSISHTDNQLPLLSSFKADYQKIYDFILLFK